MKIQSYLDAIRCISIPVKLWHVNLTVKQKIDIDGCRLGYTFLIDTEEGRVTHCNQKFGSWRQSKFSGSKI